MNDDDDVPLAFVVKSTKVASTPSPPQNGSTHHKTSEAKETGKEKDKKSKDSKKEDGKENKKEPKEGKKGKRPAEWEEIDKLTQVKPSSGKSVSWAIWFRANKTLTFFIASVVVIVGCRCGTASFTNLVVRFLTVLHVRSESPKNSRRKIGR